jgi:hypothetical protein
MTTEREAAEAFVRDFPDSGFARPPGKTSLGARLSF